MNDEAFFKGVGLTLDEQIKFSKLKQLSEEIKSKISTGSYPYEIEEEAAKLALALYKGCKSRNIDVAYSPSLIANRESAAHANPDKLEFYKHLHVIEELINFIEWQEANKEIGDVTMEHIFRFNVYSKRSKQECKGKLIRISDGWKYQFMWEEKPTNKTCDGFLKAMKTIEFIDYPNGIEDAFEFLWKQAEEGHLAIGDLQLRLDDLTKWIGATTIGKPEWY